MERLERELLELKANLRAVLLHERLIDDDVRHSAGRALQVPKFGDHHGGIRIAAGNLARRGREAGGVHARRKDEEERESESEENALHSAVSMTGGFEPVQFPHENPARILHFPMSLYRTYRPSTFADVVGQDHIVTTLEHAVAQAQLSHAYLFAGSRGTGKTSVARILAKHLLTRGIEDKTLRTQLEKGVEDGSVVDLIEIDAASNRGIDDIRTLVEKIQFSPVLSTAKVYIIDEVHMLTREAFNALLKTLEEPPPYAFFILATTELQKIPATIQSRCQRFTFRQIRDEDIVRRLQFIADREKITVDRASLRAIAHHAQGGLRDAISLLDQLRSLEKISVEDVHERLGESGHEHVEGLFQALEAGDEQQLLHLVQHLEEAGIPLDTFVRQLLTEVRTRLHAAIEADESIEGLSRILDALLTIIRDLRTSPVPGLVLEAGLLSLVSGRAPAPAAPAPVAVRRETKAHKVETAAPSAKESPAPAPAPAPATEEKPVPAAASVEAPEVSLENMIGAWPGIVGQAAPPSVKMSLKNGKVVSVSGKTVTVSFSSKFHRDRVSQQEASRKIEDLLQEHFKLNLRLECVVDEERHVNPVTDASSVDLAEAVAEIF